MKTYIERTLVKIRNISEKKNLWLSCDLYFNDLAVDRGEQFVVKIHSSVTGINEHFRTNHIRKSLKRALRFVENYQESLFDND